MAHLEMQLHAGLLRRGAPIWRQVRQSLHLRQGALDGACGPYCVAMALSILGVASKAEVRELPKEGGGRFRSLWELTLKNFFDGTDKQEMLALLETVKEHVSYQIHFTPTRRMLESVAEAIAEGGLAIVGLDAPESSHWVLAVGAERIAENEGAALTGILCLDPSEPAPPLAQFNGRIELDARVGSRQVGYRMADGALRAATCVVAFTVHRAARPGTSLANDGRELRR